MIVDQPRTIVGSHRNLHTGVLLLAPGNLDQAVLIVLRHRQHVGAITAANRHAASARNDLMISHPAAGCNTEPGT